MKCPLIRAEGYFDNKEWQVITTDCLKEECAWWDPANNCCAVRTIVSVLSRLTKKLGEGL
ncbi:hypothetical protein ES703_85346 [subsurface metagenome]